MAEMPLVVMLSSLVVQGSPLPAVKLTLPPSAAKPPLPPTFAMTPLALPPAPPPPPMD